MYLGLRIKVAEILDSPIIARVWQFMDCRSARGGFRHYLSFFSVQLGRNEIQGKIFDIFSSARGRRKIKSWNSADYSLNFKANDDNANFDNRNLNANDNYSAGLVLLGLCLNKKRAPYDGALCLKATNVANRRAFGRFLADIFAIQCIFSYPTFLNLWPNAEKFLARQI